MLDEGGLLQIALDVIELSERTMQRHHTLEPGAYVRLKVTDTGHGIEEATLDGSLIPSSPPRTSAREPGSACPWRTAL